MQSKFLLTLLVWIAVILLSVCEGTSAAASTGATWKTTGQRLLTNCAQFRELSVAQANQGWPIRLEGLVTLVDSERSLLVLQDSTGALAVRLDLRDVKIRPGQRIELEAGCAMPSSLAFPDFPSQPTGSDWLPTFSAPTNWGYYYLARMRGYVTPPTTGDYIFWLASKGAGELWLSTNASHADLQRVAFVPTGRSTSPQQWDKYSAQSSRRIHLQAGQSYLIDAIHNHLGGRDDTLAVAWQGPGFGRTLIGEQFLAPFQNRATNGIIREYWQDYFASGVESLTTGVDGQSAWAVTNPRIKVLGDEAFPEAVTVEIGAPVASADNHRWAEVEGMVAFAATDGTSLVLELVEGKSRTQVRVLGWTDTNAIRWEGTRVRARGVCESVSFGQSNAIAGVIWSPGPHELTEIEPVAGDSTTMNVTPISDLKPTNPQLAWGRRVRVRGTVVRQATNEFFIQGPGSFYCYTSTNGADWILAAPPVEIAMTNQALAGLSVSSFAMDLLTTAEFDSVVGLNGMGQSVDVSTVVPGSKATFENATYLVTGGGVGIGSSFDQFHFVFQPLNEAGEIIARVKSLEKTNPRAVAGIMIRDSLDTTASFANLAVSANGSAVFQFRQKLGERGATINLPGGIAPGWLKLTRRHSSVRVRADQNFLARLGQEVDVAGLLEWKDGQPVLDHGRSLTPSTLRKSVSIRTSPASASGEPSLVSLAQLIPQDGEGLRDGAGSIRVRGVVTFNEHVFGTNYLFIQDQTAGSLVRLTSRFSRKPLRVGDLVEFNLRSVNGKWPIPLEPSALSVIGTSQLPAPLVHPAEYSLPRHGEAHWTEFEGVVQKVNEDGTLILARSDGKIAVWIGAAKLNALRRYVDAMVRVRGVLTRSSERTYTLLVPALEFVAVQEPPPEPFQIPRISISDLKNFDHRSAAFHRVKVAGVVVGRKEDLLLLQDESGGARVKLSEKMEVEVGDSIEVAGFPEFQMGIASLSEALGRKTAPRVNPEVVRLSPEEMLEGGPDATVVQLTGQLIRQDFSSETEVLELQSGQQIFRAALTKGRERLAIIPLGSRVEVTGVCWVERNEAAFSNVGSKAPLVASFEVILRTPLDVIVRQRPPWWTWKHTTAAVGGLGFILVGALVWIRLLHRQVAQRTHELELAMTKLEQETELSATLAERNRLAGELHDGLEQSLSAVMMQLDRLESKLTRQPSEAAQQLQLTRNMVRFSRTEIRFSLWDWKSPALANRDLSAVLTDIAGQMSAGKHAQVSVQVSGMARALPAAIEHHLLRIGQEALNNALKYAQAATVKIHLDYSGAAVRLSVRDDGLGFVPESVLNGSAGHLGIQSLRSRARKMGGQLTVTSAPGDGTTIEVTVAIRADNPSPSQSE